MEHLKAADDRHVDHAPDLELDVIEADPQARDDLLCAAVLQGGLPDANAPFLQRQLDAIAVRSHCSVDEWWRWVLPTLEVATLSIVQSFPG